MSKLTQEELLRRLAWFYNLWSINFPEAVIEEQGGQAYAQLKEIVGNAYTIPTTSEREAELEKIITKMQDELDKKPTVTMKRVGSWEDKWTRRYNYSGIMIDEILEMLKEAGVEVT